MAAYYSDAICQKMYRNRDASSRKSERERDMRKKKRRKKKERDVGM
jgi:hypothetical protein